jgi:hypothetical protein
LKRLFQLVLQREISQRPDLLQPIAALAATALHEALVGPLAPDNMDDPGKLRDAVQTVTLPALAPSASWTPAPRGLVVQTVLPAKAPVGA